jgi:hypothetical protein
MTPLATVEALEERLDRELTEGEATQAEALIKYASALVRAYTGCAWADGNAPDGVAEVVIEMVFRSISNPLGATQDTAGPFSVSFGAQAAQRLYLTAGDRIILDANRCRSQLNVIGTTRGPMETPTVRPIPHGDIEVELDI